MCHLTPDTWHITPDFWHLSHMTFDMWHVTNRRLWTLSRSDEPVTKPPIDDHITKLPVSICPGFPSHCSNRLAKKDKRILFLGNSYTYYNDLPGKIRDWVLVLVLVLVLVQILSVVLFSTPLPGQVRQVAAAAGYKAEVGSNSKGEKL